jgi:hypothetical protein
MKRCVAIASGTAFAAVITVAALAGRGGSQRPLVLRPPAPPSPLLGLEWNEAQSWLVRLDPNTLRIRRGHRLALGRFSYSGASSFSPGRRLIAFGSQATEVDDGRAALRLVNARTLRKLRDVPLGLSGYVASTAWAAPARLLALVRSRDTDTVVAVEPSTLTIVARRGLGERVLALAKGSDSLVLVLGGEGFGPVQLAVAARDGSVRAVQLERIEAGTRVTQGGVPRHDGAAVAVDRDAGRAYVVAANCPVAEVDLDTLTVTYHTPTQPVSLLGRLHDWLEPKAEAKGPLEGTFRSAVWLGDGRLAVFGRDASTYAVGDGLSVRTQPSGLRVIDTRTWSAQTIDPRSSALAVGKDALLSWGLSWDSGTDRTTGTGLSIFDSRGLRHFHLFGPRPVYDVQVIGDRAFVRKQTLDHRYSIVSLKTGKQVRTIRGREMPIVLSGESSPFYG